jgi:outer membrane beta-barrel protein
MKKIGIGSQNSGARIKEQKSEYPYSESGVIRQRPLEAVLFLIPDSWLLNSSFTWFVPWFTLLALLTMLLLFPAPREGFGADATNDGHVYATQNEDFHCYHEIGASLGYFPNDDFYHLYPLGLHYTFHINENLAWEVARGYLVLNQAKDLRKDLEKKCGVEPVEFKETKYMIHTHLVVKPFYGKDTIWNRYILNHEGYFFFGPGMVRYEDQVNRYAENAFSASFGYGIKYFIHKNLCMNFEIRDLVNFREERTENLLGLSLGMGFRCNLAPKEDK